MKIQDIHIGSWVRGNYDEDCERKYRDFKVVNILGRMEEVESEEGEIFFIDDCTGIPLTEEMLKANGFEEFRSGMYQIVRYRLIAETDAIIMEPMLIESRLGDAWFWFANKDRELEPVKPRLSYPLACVHELQNALIACGLYDIAVNFKID